MTEAMALWEKVKAAVHFGEEMQEQAFVIVLRRLKKWNRGNCCAKSSQPVRERRGRGMMNRRIGMSPILCAALLLSAGVARAPRAPPHPGGDVTFHRVGSGDDFMAPPMGERIECWA